MRERAWYHVAASVESNKITVWQRALSPEFNVNDSGEASKMVTGLCQAFETVEGPFVISASRSTDRSIGMHFNGKIEIEQPFIYRGPIQYDEIGKFLSLLVDPNIVVLWDFCIGMDTQNASSVGSHKLDAKLVNIPTRGMNGSTWSGKEMCFRYAPYLPSGVYGAHLKSDVASNVIPFYVRPKIGEPTSKVLFLASTFTYQIYANHVRGNADEDYFRRARAWGASLSHPDLYHQRYGASTYNLHSDGSGICYSSRLRPIMTMRPGFLTFNDPSGSGLRHFQADTHILDWLDSRRISFDVITDEDLHSDGLDLLKPYNVVLTGSHPEYHTLNTLNSLQSYTSEGGRLMYLGGNGFYWRIATSSTLPGFRRKLWRIVATQRSATTTPYWGGLFQPRQFEGSYYVRTKESYDHRVSWIFDSVKEDELGSFGLSGGGAAGFELDRADRNLGTPHNCVVLAKSQGHSNTFIPVHEEMLTHCSTATGDSPDKLIHADMVFFETAGGGAVFSTGSITFCGSLSYNNYQNNISQILSDVLRHFSDDKTLPSQDI